jgi:hypothetical protein
VGLKIVANCSDVVPKRAKSLVWALWANSGYNEVDDGLPLRGYRTRREWMILKSDQEPRVGEVLSQIAMCFGP